MSGIQVMGSVKTFDYAVIGAGATGLLTACYLSRKGKVAVIDQNEFPGGFAGTFHKDGFSYNIGAHFVPATFKKEDYIGNFLDEFPDYKEEIGSLFQRTNLGCIIRDQVYQIDNHEDFFSSLKTDYPEEKSAIEEFESIFNSTLDMLYNPATMFRQKEGQEQSGEGWNTLSYVTDQNLEKPESAHLLIDSMFRSEELKKRLVGMSIWPGGSFEFFCIYLDIFLDKGVYTVTGGFEKFWDKLVGIIRGNGGEVFLGKRVEHVRIENNKVTGCILAGGDIIEAGNIISTISVKKFYSELVDKTEKSALMESRLNLPYSVSAIQATWGFSEDICGAIQPGYYVIVPERFPDLKQWFIDTEQKTLNMNFPVWVFVSSPEMEISAPGQSLIQAIFPIYGEVYRSLTKEEKQKLLASLKSLVFSKASTNLSIDEESLVFEEWADPDFYAKQFSADAGSIFGWHVSVKNSLRPKSKSKVFGNLFHAGQWVLLGGLPGSFWSARLISELVEKYAKSEVK